MAFGGWKGQTSQFMPVGTGAFLRARLTELAGAVLLAAALALALALASFDARDASLNVASGPPVANWLGVHGAIVADLILQTLGLAAALLVLVLGAWGWRLAAHRGIALVWWRIAALPPLVLIGALGLAALPAPAAWPLLGGPGGLIGDLLHGWFAAALAALDLAAHAAIADGIVGALCLLLAVFVLGLDRGDVRDANRAGRAGYRLAGRLASHLARGFAALRARLARPREAAVVASPPTRREPVLVEGGAGAESGEGIALAPPREVTKPRRPKLSKRGENANQASFDLSPHGIGALPPLYLLREPPDRGRIAQIDEDALVENARRLETVLDDYGVRGQIINVRPGPVVTLYELEPAPGLKSSRVIGLADDIARSMSAISVRVAVVPGRNVIGIELPNQRRESVLLRALLATGAYEDAGGALNLALGKDIGGAPVVADLSGMPHLLIAGTTGSGKSVAINTMILSLLYRLTPEQCRLILIDPKMLELSVYDDIPHLLTPVVTDPSKAIVALKWVVREMEQRYRAMADLGVRNIANYNQRLAEAAAAGEALKRTVQTGFDPQTGEPIFEDQILDLAPMPFIVVVVDEMADLMMVAGKDIEAAIQRLAQMARAAGIHLIMATQRPSVDVITGTIKANFPTRISFQVTSKIDSRTILGEQGAEQLLGEGDMLYMAGGGRILRVHGPFVSDEEVEAIATFLKKQGRPEYLEAVVQEPDEDDPGNETLNETLDQIGLSASGGDNALYDQAVDVVARFQKASTSFVQRKLGIGYNRAARLIEQMEDDGVIGPANHVGKREIFVRDPDET